MRAIRFTNSRRLSTFRRVSSSRSKSRCKRKSPDGDVPCFSSLNSGNPRRNSSPETIKISRSLIARSARVEKRILFEVSSICRYGAVYRAVKRGLRTIAKKKEKTLEWSLESRPFSDNASAFKARPGYRDVSSVFEASEREACLVVQCAL